VCSGSIWHTGQTGERRRPIGRRYSEGGGRRRGRRRRLVVVAVHAAAVALQLLRLLALLFLVADPARACLVLADLAEVEADGARGKGVGLRAAAVLLEGGAEAADEGVETAPGLAERAGAGRRRVRVAEEGARCRMHLGLTELIQVAQELEHVRAAALRQAQRRAVVPQVLPERVPVAPLLRLVPARGLRRLRPHGRRRATTARPHAAVGPSRRGAVGVR
jgi:hypothetical protein